MGMDAGPAAGKSDAILIYKTAVYGWGIGCNIERLMEKLFIIKMKFISGNSDFCHNFCDFWMSVRKFFPFSRLIAGFLFLTAGKRSFLPDLWNC